ncbi:MAG: 4Fe-4S binding protein [Desulfovibrio sp.]|nr:4Fe-4S binding protein [Desulfovibrio sp.]
MPSPRHAQVERERCVSCGSCANECPRDAISVWRGCFAIVDRTKCIGCGKCVRVCPADCISIVKREAAQ